ncbi:Strongly-conserved Zn-finger binding protein (TFIIIA), partial [Ceratobasidium sp. 428]
MEASGSINLALATYDAPPKQFTKLAQPIKYPQMAAHFSNSNQTSDEDSSASDDSGSDYDSDEVSSHDANEQLTASSSKSSLGVRRPEYLLINGKPVARSKCVKPYVCTYGGCGKSYRKPSRLEEHERSHTGETNNLKLLTKRPFVCSNCQKTYLRESHLRAHSRSHLPPSARPFVCTHPIITTAKRLNEGLMSTQREASEPINPASFRIPSCNQRFWTAQHLRVHELAIHLGDKPYKCTSCPAAFMKHGALRVHNSEAHAPPGTKPYQCEHPACSQSFTTNQKLKIHARVHD